MNKVNSRYVYIFFLFIQSVIHHYLVFLISKSHIQDLNPTFGFQKPNLAFTNLIYKRALTRVLKKNNLGFKNQIWLFKLSFENQIFNSKTVFRKPHLYLKHTFGLCIEIRIRFLKTKFVSF